MSAKSVIELYINLMCKDIEEDYRTNQVSWHEVSRELRAVGLEAYLEDWLYDELRSDGLNSLDDPN